MNREKIKILHIYNDPKFHHFILKTFELDELQNDIININENKSKLESNSYSAIVIHYLSNEIVRFINANKINIPIIIFIWGADIFSLGKFYNSFLEKKTWWLRNYLSFRSSIILGLSNLFKSFFPFLIDINIYSKLKIKVLNSVDVLVPILPADYFLLKKYYNIDVPSFHLNYINPLFEKEFPFSNLKKNILLGNSSSYTNNHIEAIEILSKIVSSDYKIIIPLNYGDKYLSDFIIKYAKKKLLKNNLMFLTEFIEFDKYQEIISDCEIVIMNHLRQQALGNIIQAIYTGVHVYLNPSSPVYKYLLENDIFVSAFNLDSILCSLTETQKAKNRILIKNVFGPNVQKQRLKKLLFEYINLNLSK